METDCTWSHKKYMEKSRFLRYACATFFSIRTSCSQKTIISNIIPDEQLSTEYDPSVRKFCQIRGKSENQEKPVTFMSVSWQRVTFLTSRLRVLVKTCTRHYFRRKIIRRTQSCHNIFEYVIAFYFENNFGYELTST